MSQGRTLYMFVYLYGPFLVSRTTQSTLQYSFAIRTNIHTVQHFVCEKGQFGVQYLAQGHFGIAEWGRLRFNLQLSDPLS